MELKPKQDKARQELREAFNRTSMELKRPFAPHNGLPSRNF